METEPRCLGRYPLGPSLGCAVEGSAGQVSKSQHLLAPTKVVAGAGRLAENLACFFVGTGRKRPIGLGRGFHGRNVHSSKKRGPKVGKTKRGKGSKLMVVADGKGIPMGVSLHSASPHEITLAEETLENVSVPRKGPGRSRKNPDRLIADKAYDSEPFRRRLARRGIELIAPHKSNRRKAATQDGRSLRRYRKRWKIARTIAWIGNYRRLVVRWDRRDDIYLSFVYIACALTTCNHL
ncbi:IS5 family transposase [Candidatus Parcubacteria bacterium]|nr:MAG: IS5 family transposase [Candidatus Parcubacteria bacterium]